jgi:hypothetical protein
MARFEHRLTGNVDLFIAHLDRAILIGSVTANIESGADLRLGDARMVVRVYERFGALGGNRVSLSVSVLSVGAELMVSAITSGGSTAMFWKVNTVGERTFLQKAVDAVASFGR